MPSKKRASKKPREEYMCPILTCGRFFSEKRLLTRHVLFHGGKINLVTNLRHFFKILYFKGICPFMCQTCGSAFKQKVVLK